LHVEGFKLQNPPSQPVPVYLAALGPRNVRLTGEIADGWLPIFVPRAGLSELMGQLQAGARGAGRDAASLAISAYVPAVAGPRAERLLREQIAYYLGGTGTFYARYLSGLGFGADVEAVRARWQEGDRRAAVAAVSSSILERCTLSVVPQEAKRQLTEYASDGIDSVIAALPNGASPEEVTATLQALSAAASTA
jgi:alkanesulfonate monooxygenase SsuD/methylene tetrahydromethanopterin reductase-like flavin-dependent oxidoreductase (luciferase family)